VSDAPAKKHTLANFKFASQIAPPNCTIIFTKHEKSCATIYQGQCKRASCNCPFMQNKPYPLLKQGFYGSPIARRKLRGVPRDGHAIAAKCPARNPAKCLASYPRNAPAMPPDGRMDDSQDNLPCAGFGRAMSAPETCETTHQNLIVNHDPKKL